MKNKILVDMCANCGICFSACPIGAIEWENNIPVITDACTQCHECVLACPVGAIDKEY
jgi:electron transport complex protein RnfB